MTYAGLALPFVGVSVGLLAAGVLLRRPGRGWWLATGATLIALLVLTAVFDNLMIAVDLFRYQEDQISGITLGLAPIEDFAWPIAAALGLPGLSLLLARPNDRTGRE
ncbi:lycopene cyclase domain-containing protein [Aeromicrobium phragmitis]|uniref:Lycopene cyclase domain-containing protein n=1 Tax=Aeromicrobium phragmitis TaxID=2478914 RepID=A0A3L8PQ04_9ACTN|nr:lycopene cyclase domain-containing protein [Aeromicrobium phragmitis]RLV56793.1 lycopene cyclase domain-containing protein [Aeromicrobium phragmitis]